MANKQIKKCLISLVIRKMQNKTVMRIVRIATLLELLQAKLTIPSVGKIMEQLPLSAFQLGVQSGITSL